MVNVNSLVCFKAKKEAENICQIPSNIAKQKLNCHISSLTTRQTVRQTNVKNELTILRIIVMVKFSSRLI